MLAGVCGLGLAKTPKQPEQPKPLVLAPEPVVVATIPEPVTVVKVEHDPGPNLVRNGDFEIGIAPGKFSWLNPGSQEIDSWQIVDGQIDYVGFAWSAASGKRSIDLNGSPGKGSIAQTIYTEPGTHYEVTFYLAGNPMGNDNGADPIKHMRVELRTGNEITGRYLPSTQPRVIQPISLVKKEICFPRHRRKNSTHV